MLQYVLLKNIRNINIKTSRHQNNYYKLYYTVVQPLNNETASLLPVKIERKKVWTFVELFYEFKVARYTFLKILWFGY